MGTECLHALWTAVYNMHMGWRNGLEKWMDEFGEWLPRKLDACQGVHCVRHYARWVKYDQDFKPRLSKDFFDDGDMARKFLNAVRFFGIGQRTGFPNTFWKASFEISLTLNIP